MTVSAVPFIRGRQYLAAILFISALQAPAQADHNPAYLQVSLWSPIDSAHAKPGQTIDAKVLIDWVTPECILHKGAHVRGHVLDVQRSSKTLKDSHVAASFDLADCSGHKDAPLKLQIVEIVNSPDVSPERLTDALPGTNGDKRRGLAPASAMNLKSDEPITVHPGEVQGMKNVTLRLGAGPQGSTLFVASDRNLHLPGGTILILSPDSLAPVQFKLQTTN